MPSSKSLKSPLTLGDLVKKVSKLKLNQVLYILLLVAVFFIGYLVAKVQFLESAKTQNTAAAPAAQAPQQPAAPSASDVLKKLTAGHFPALGNQNAKVTVVEFADFRCPFCERFFTDTESQIKKDYIDTGKVKFIFRQYAFLGDASVVAANAAECANEQGKFWDYHDWLYKNQPAETDTSMYNTDSLTQTAGTLGLDTAKFRTCLDAKKYSNDVQKDFSEGQSVGVSGTPTFYIDGQQLVGAQPYSAFKAIIDQELAKK